MTRKPSWRFMPHTSPIGIASYSAVCGRQTMRVSGSIFPKRLPSDHSPLAQKPTIHQISRATHRHFALGTTVRAIRTTYRLHATSHPDRATTPDIPKLRDKSRYLWNFA